MPYIRSAARGRWSRPLHRFSLQMGGASYIVQLLSIFAAAAAAAAADDDDDDDGD